MLTILYHPLFSTDMHKTMNPFQSSRFFLCWSLDGWTHLSKHRRERESARESRTQPDQKSVNIQSNETKVALLPHTFTHTHPRDLQNVCK